MANPTQSPLGIIYASSHFKMSTGERPFLDILQDRRYWLIHLITIPSLFLAGVIFIDSPFVYKLFGQPSFNEYFYNHDTLRHISLINDRFPGLNEISDI
jgi:photosystem II cytochrome b559 subunit alpha